MPLIDLMCVLCHTTFRKVVSIAEIKEHQIEQCKKYDCSKCQTRTSCQRLIPNFSVSICGYTVNKQHEANKHLANAEEAMHDAKVNGVSKTEIEEGRGLLAEREKEKGLDPGSLTGKRESRWDPNTGKMKDKFTRENVKKRMKKKKQNVSHNKVQW